MMGQRRAMVCKLDMLPPPGETWRVEVERERRVAGEVFFKKGHMDFDWRRTVSMMADCNGQLYFLLRLVMEWHMNTIKEGERMEERKDGEVEDRREVDVGGRRRRRGQRQSITRR